ncbi:serine/threonine-protein phosphatase 7 long form-like protein, partial [Trifolium medium]|nr:serine/threonine-protein phosphatase 7 long form-like protein [Trifolium medium]
ALVPISHRKKMKELAKIALDAQWFRDRVEATGLADLAKIGYEHLDPCLISAFAERWHADTSTFHMPVGEITVTLDDVSCLPHLPISGHLLDHTPLSKDQGIDALVNLLGANPADAHSEVSKTKGNHATLTYLKGLFTDHLDQLAVFTLLGDEQSCEKYRRYALRVYLMLLVGYTIFAGSSKNCVQLWFAQYFDDLELANTYAWGASALAFLYNGLSATNTPKWTTVTCYMTLLQAWIHAHFPRICGRV